MKHIIISVFFVLLCLLGFSNNKTESKEIGKRYAGWSIGEFEIHQISTNRGESSFLIFPDGTSLLIDLGDHQYGYSFPSTIPMTLGAGEYVAEYVKDFNPSGKTVDYLLVTHFHSDHMGDMKMNFGVTNGRINDYQLTGIAEAGEFLSFRKIIDRGWPDYNFPLPVEKDNVSFFNYRKFVDWKMKSENVKMEKFVVGVDDQFVQLKEKQKAKNFSVRNITSSGTIWAGIKNQVNDLVSANSKNTAGRINENSMSTGMLFQYGKFKYFTAGDLCKSFLQKNGEEINIEVEAGKLVGEIDVCKSNHHGYTDALMQDFINSVNAKVYITPVWDSKHIHAEPMGRIIANPKSGKETLIFPTHISDEQRTKFKDYQFLKHIPVVTGHTVVKVARGGKKYKIYILKDSDASREVLGVYGPFMSK